MIINSFFRTELQEFTHTSHDKRFGCRAFALIIFLSLLLISCSKKNDSVVGNSNTSLLLGFSQIGAESAWRTCNTASMEDAALAANIQMLYENAEQKQENQIKAIRSFIVYQVDVIVFVPIVQDGWDNVLREARDANIPVIILDRMINTADESLYTSYIGSDSLEEGRNAARFLLRKFKGQKGPFNILELRGTDGASVTEGRHNGFCEILDKDPRFSIVYSESGDYLRSCGREIALSLINNDIKETAIQDDMLQIDGKTIDIIFSHNDMMTLGAMEIFDKHGIDSGNKLTIVSVDAQQEAIDALKAGKINCVIECNPKQGPDCIRYIQAIARGNAIPKIFYVPETTFSEFDDLSQIEPRGY